MVSDCRGSVDREELVGDTVSCLSYLDQSDRYLHLPNVNGRRDSHQEADPNQVHEYHTYWHGPWTWRVELFIKGFLYTQNLKVSRLTIWFDTKFAEDIVSQVQKDPRTQQFSALLQQGILNFKPWSMPDTISLPDGLDHTDGYGYVDNDDRRGKYVDSEVIADAIQRDPSGKVFMRTDIWGIASEKDVPARSDTFRFLILHAYGGVYLDMDMLLLRDMNPLLASNLPFAERWGNLKGLGDYNTAVLALPANSSLSSFCVRAGVRARMFFHPRAIGYALWQAGRHEELLRLESAVFDPLWPELAGTREGKAPEPLHQNSQQFFEAKSGPEATTPSEDSKSVDPRINQFYRGAFAYHIHNMVSYLISCCVQLICQV